MTTRTFIPLLGKRLRVTALDECGNLPEGGTANSVITTNGFVTVNLSAEVEDGTEILSKRADGSFYINEKKAASFKRLNVGITLAGVNPSLLAFTTNAEEYADYNDDIAGFTLPEGPITKNFALELWTGLSGEACADGEIPSGYLLLPFVGGGTIGDMTIDSENGLNAEISGAYTKGGNTWGVGPYDVVYDDSEPPVAAALPTALDTLDHLLLLATGLTPPPEAASPAAMPGGE